MYCSSKIALWPFYFSNDLDSHLKQLIINQRSLQKKFFTHHGKYWVLAKDCLPCLLDFASVQNKLNDFFFHYSGFIWYKWICWLLSSLWWSCFEMWRSTLTCKEGEKKRVNLSLRVGVANLRYSRDDNKTIFLMTNIFDLTVMHSQEIFIVRIISVYL